MFLNTSRRFQLRQCTLTRLVIRYSCLVDSRFGRASANRGARAAFAGLADASQSFAVLLPRKFATPHITPPALLRQWSTPRCAHSVMGRHLNARCSWSKWRRRRSPSLFARPRSHLRTDRTRRVESNSRWGESQRARQNRRLRTTPLCAPSAILSWRSKRTKPTAHRRRRQKSPRTDRPCGSTTCSFIGRASTRTRRCPEVSKLPFYLKKESDLSYSETAALRLRSESNGASVSRARVCGVANQAPVGEVQAVRSRRFCCCWVLCAKPGLLNQP